MFIAFKDHDGFFKGGQDDYVYAKIDINNPFTADKFDKAVGKMDFRAKTAAEVHPGQYVFEPNKKFNYSGNNPTEAVGTLHKGLDTSLKSAGITDFNKDVYSVVLTHALEMSEDYDVELGESPTTFIKKLASSNNPVAKEAMNQLKSGNITGYLSAFQNAGEMTTREANTILKNMQNIIRGYGLLANQLEE